MVATRQPEFRRIPDGKEIEPGRSERRCRQAAIAGSQQIANPLGRAFPLTDMNQAADQIPYHVMKKGRGLEVEGYQITETPYMSLAHHLHR